MRHYFYPAAYSLVWVLLASADALTTNYLVKNMPGNEINPFVDTSSLWSLMFSPVLVALMVGCIVIVILSEIYHKTMPVILAKRPSFIFFVCILPYFIIFIKGLAVLNNGMIIFGWDGPVSWFVTLVKEYGLVESDFVASVFLCSFLFVIFAPLWGRYLDMRYRTENWPNESE